MSRPNVMKSYDAKGAYGKVKREFRNGQWAAVKRVHGGAKTHHDMDMEFEIYKQGAHPNIVKLLERPVICFDFMWEIVMEWIFGDTLEKIIFDYRSSSIQLTPEITGRIITGMCEGLFHLHRNNIVHQDLKPDNIMVESYTYQAVIIDMGSAKFFHNGLGSAENRGNLAYAAPEIMAPWCGERDFRSDVWAMGKIIAELLFEHRLAANISPDRIQNNLEGNIYCNVVSRMLQGSPIPRATMAQVIGEVREAEHLAGQRRSMSKPDSQVQTYQPSGGSRGAFSGLTSSLGLPQNFHVDPPHNGTVRINSVGPSQGGGGMSKTQGEFTFNNGRFINGWWVTVDEDGNQAGNNALDC